MSNHIVKVISNEIGEFTITMYDNLNCYGVTGTGIKSRSFARVAEAIEFAQDQLLILTLENELAIEAN